MRDLYLILMLEKQKNKNFYSKKIIYLILKNLNKNQKLRKYQKMKDKITLF